VGVVRALLLLCLGTALAVGPEKRAQAQSMASPYPMRATPALGIAADASSLTGADVLQPYLNVRTVPSGASTAGLLQFVDRHAPRSSNSGYGNNLTTSF
jgi:hypothetical protein